MTKKITALLAVLLLLLSFSMPVFAANSHKVVDLAGFMSDDERSKLNEKLKTIYKEEHFDVVVVTTTDLYGKSAMEYADDYYDYNGYGYGPDHDGCLLLIKVTSENDREYWISTTGYGITALTDYGIEYIGDKIVPSLRDGKYYKASNIFASLVNEFVEESKNNMSYDYGHEYNRKYKSVKKKNTLKVKEKTITAGSFVLKKRSLIYKRKSYLRIKNAKGKVSYKKIKGNKKVLINSKTGRLILKKGLKKGTYFVKVKVKAAGTKYYKKATKTVTLKIVVK